MFVRHSFTWGKIVAGFGAPGDGFTVCHSPQSALQIGAEETGSCPLQPFQSLLVRMSVGIAGAAADDGKVRTDRLEKRCGGGGGRAVVSQTEDIRL